MIWDDTDLDESEFCPCGVTLMGDPDEDNGLCGVCAGVPHGRECPCDECEAYWREVSAASRAAVEAYDRARASASPSHLPEEGDHA